MISNLKLLLDAAATSELVNETAQKVETDLIQGAEQASMAQMIPSLLMMVAMVAVFYFLLIRPQKKKDKAVKDMLSALKAGDRICTIGGIYGTVTGIKDDTVTIAVGVQKAPMVIARWAVRSIEDAPLENDAEPSV